jgi:hypothetical protein
VVRKENEKDTEADAQDHNGELELKRTVSPQGGKEGRLPGGSTVTEQRSSPDNLGGVRGDDPDF